VADGVPALSHYAAERVTEEWDGHPRVALTHAQMLQLFSFVPQWQGVAVGPPVPFVGHRARVEVAAIFRETREEAEEAVWFQVRNACAEQRMEFDQDEWKITHLALVGGN